ncbi:EFR1 family ferrodoxin [Allofournierella sp.]|uniref:EFR1 family ferrodoxin n=1 Tax=Allofournierella sp. TaxID=1940256 RepID=UPI003AB75695
MILYFSGTGNSEYAAKRIGRELGDEAIDLFEKIKTGDCREMHSERPWVVVAPTYAWRIPRIVHKWLEAVKLTGNRDMYFVMTCGGDIGNAGSHLKPLCAGKGMNYRGCTGIRMPENYIALFKTPGEEEAAQIIGQAEGLIDRAAEMIGKGERLPEPELSLGDKLNSGIVNAVFYPLFVHAKKFYATGACISCGKCAAVCPLDNVRLKDGRPVWGDRCTHCMACICRCPAQAIEYGKHSQGLPRYTCPKKV